MNARILVIEDNLQSRYLARYLLEHHGHTVLEAASGPDGLLVAEQTRPDLILLDIQLPDLDGYSLARLLTHHPQLHSTPILAITSFAMPGDREKCLEAGAWGYLEKPINPETFASDIERFLTAVNTKARE